MAGLDRAKPLKSAQGPYPPLSSHCTSAPALASAIAVAVWPCVDARCSAVRLHSKHMPVPRRQSAKPSPSPHRRHSLNDTLANPRPSGSQTRTQIVPARIRRVDVRALRQQRFHAPRVALTRRVVQRCALRRAARTKKAALVGSTDHQQATGRKCLQKDTRWHGSYHTGQSRSRLPYIGTTG
jgi:hypothetical protein